MFLTACLLCAPLSARAALTDSEKAQVRGFVQKGKVGNAARIRALVARPDLSADEAAEPLSAGYAAVPFDDAREKLTRELLLGPGSLAARSELAVPVVRALLARASRALGSMPALEVGSEAVKTDVLAREVVRIHRFVADVLANAGHPPADGHDAAQGIRDDTLGKLVDLYRAHVESHATLFGPGQKLSPSLVPVRVQAALTLIDLARGIRQRREVSKMLGLGGVKQELFERHGVWIEDGGAASDARLTRAVRFVSSSPRATEGLGAWLIHKAPASGLGARGAIVRASVTLGSAAGKPTETQLFTDDVEPAAADRELAEVAFSAALIVARSAMRREPAYATTAQRIAERALRASASGELARELGASVLVPEGATASTYQGVSAPLYAAHSLQLLMLDAPRALDSAAARALSGRDEPLAQFALALSLLAATSGSADEVEVGVTEADGSVTPKRVTGIRLSGGLVSAFELDGRKVELALSTDGKVDRLRIDGQEPRLSKLPRARLVPKAADSWLLGDTRWEKLGGAPLGLAVDDGRFVLAAAEGSDGFDAVVTGAPGKDQTVHATVRVKGRGGGLLLRGQPGDKSYDGVALLLSASPPKATLVLVDGKGKAIELSPAVELGAPGPEGFVVSLGVRGPKVSGLVDGKKLEAKLNRGAGSGRPGLMVVAGGHIEVSGFGPGPAAAPKARDKRPASGEKKRP